MRHTLFLEKILMQLKLCKYKSDVFDSNPVSISTATEASANNLSYLAKINPPLEFTNGNDITFDVSDQSLLDMKLDFYEDLNFRERLDVSGTNDTQFNILRDGVSGNTDATVTIRTSVRLAFKNILQFDTCSSLRFKKDFWIF